MKRIERNLEKIKSITNTGKITSALFIKKDGSLRKLVFRSHVTKGINGGGLKYNPQEKGYLTQYDMKNKGYRMLNINTLISIKAQGKEYIVE